MAGWTSSIHVSNRQPQIVDRYTDYGSVKLHADPTVILLSMRVDESVDAQLDPERASRGSVNRDGRDHLSQKDIHLRHYEQLISFAYPTSSKYALPQSLVMNLERTNSSTSALAQISDRV